MKGKGRSVLVERDRETAGVRMSEVTKGRKLTLRMVGKKWRQVRCWLFIVDSLWGLCGARSCNHILS